MPVQPFNLVDPFTQVYRAIHGLLKGSGAVMSVVKSIPDLTAIKPVNEEWFKQTVAACDLPELLLMETNNSGFVPTNNKIWSTTQTYTIWLTTDTVYLGGEATGTVPPRLNTVKTAVEFALMSNNGGDDTLGLLGLVRTYSVRGGKETRFGAAPQRGSTRYTGVLQVEVEMYFGRTAVNQFILNAGASS